MLLASHTGSGKTLAYLLPVVGRADLPHPFCTHWLAAPINLTMMTAGQVKLLKDAEQQGEERAKPKRPRAIVLGPTRELTDQILGVAKSMSHFAKFRSACVNGGQRSHHRARPPLAVLMEAYCTATEPFAASQRMQDVVHVAENTPNSETTLSASWKAALLGLQSPQHSLAAALVMPMLQRASM